MRRWFKCSRFLILIGFLYVIKKLMDSQPLIQQSQINEQINLPLEELLNDKPTMQLGQKEQSSGSIFSFILGIFTFVLSIIPTIFVFIWNVITFLFGIIQHIWTIVVILINVGYIYITFSQFRNRQKTVVTFVQTLFVVLILPTLVNYFITNEDLALRLFLPIYMALFVDSQGRGPQISHTFIRNLVFFILVLAIL